jgi:hypothetical protein
MSHHVHKNISDHAHAELMVIPYSLKLLQELVSSNPLLNGGASKQVTASSDDSARDQGPHVTVGDML